MIKFFRHINSKHLYFTTSLVILLLLFSCNEKQTLPDLLKAGWKGKTVCEVLEDHKELRVLKMYI